MDDLYQQLGGHLQWQNLRELQKVLQRRGGAFFVAGQRTLERRTRCAIHGRETKAASVIIDLQKFITNERPFWAELEKFLEPAGGEPDERLSLAQVQRFHQLYERTAADLARITTFSSEPETRRYLENLVARAYGEIHETREKQRRFFPLAMVFSDLAANISPTHPRFLPFAGHHHRRLRVWRAGPRV